VIYVTKYQPTFVLRVRINLIQVKAQRKAKTTWATFVSYTSGLMTTVLMRHFGV